MSEPTPDPTENPKFCLICGIEKEKSQKEFCREDLSPSDLSFVSLLQMHVFDEKKTAKEFYGDGAKELDRKFSFKEDVLEKEIAHQKTVIAELVGAAKRGIEKIRILLEQTNHVYSAGEEASQVIRGLEEAIKKATPLTESNLKEK